MSPTYPMEIIAWTILITDQHGNEYTSADMPDYVSQVIDEWLSENGSIVGVKELNSN